MTWKVPYSGISNRPGLEEATAVLQALQQDALSFGPLVPKLAAEFAAFTGAKHAVTVSSCTAALQLTVQLLRLQPGDEIISTPQTFWATLWPLVARRCRIRFADIDPNSLNIDPNTIEPLITPKTKAIYLVHHGGQAADLDPVLEIARRHGLRVVEDCAHAPGARYKGRCVGTLGDFGCFSFHSLKNMTAGEGGMLVTNDEELLQGAPQLLSIGALGEMRERAERTIGPYAEPKYHRDGHARNAYRLEYVRDDFEVGTNYRMSELEAALALVQLRRLDELNERRRTIARRLNDGLRDVPGIVLQQEKPYAYHIYHLYTLFFQPEVVGACKDDFIRCLEQDEGIQIILRYFPVHLLPEFRARGHRFGECPVAEKVYFEQQVELPIYGHLSDEQIEHMIRGVRRSIERLTC
ncbi:MAG: DegT/DnrJ/EryC1/StrS family aminotransferase [Anaerolineae bacterium]